MNTSRFLPLSPFEALRAWVASCLRSLGRLLFGRRGRNRERVMSDYHAGFWQRILEEKAWTRAPDLRSFLAGEGTHSIVARIDGRMRRMTLRDYYDYRIDAFAGALGRWLNPEGEIVELGSGTGYNLLSLASSWPHARLRGFDLSPNGVEAARQSGAHFGLADRVSFGQLDLTRADQEAWQQVRGRDVFTFFCLEQIPYEIEAVVRNILRAGPRCVYHVEPGTAQLRWWRPADWPNYLYVWSMSYQTELTRCLEKLAAEGEIEILHTGRMPFSPTIQNTGFVAVWRPSKRND
jgi:hypothetical protein